MKKYYTTTIILEKNKEPVMDENGIYKTKDNLKTEFYRWNGYKLDINKIILKNKIDNCQQRQKQ